LHNLLNAARVIVITRAMIIRRLRSSDRALLLREVAPDTTQDGLARTREVLLELQHHQLVTMNLQTDRWRYCGPEIRA
jgi:hypothetical protein